jgi:hypothetical protein
MRLLWRHKKLFIALALLYALLGAVLVGVASQDKYSQIATLLDNTTKSFLTGTWGEIGKAGLLLASGIGGTFTPQLSEGQQIYNGFLILMTWLTTVWLLRAIFAGRIPKLRDAMYNAGSPIIATVLVFLYIILQSAPLVLAVVIVSSISSLTGAMSMMFWLAALLLAVLSLYFMSGSFMALVVVTLPGMYPWRAIRAAGDLVVGRRVRLLLRVAWLALTIAFIWALAIIPAILLSRGLVKLLPAIASVPLIPIVLSLSTSFATVWAAAYIYMLYRKVVGDDAKPA